MSAWRRSWLTPAACCAAAAVCLAVLVARTPPVAELEDEVASDLRDQNAALARQIRDVRSRAQAACSRPNGGAPAR